MEEFVDDQCVASLYSMGFCDAAKIRNALKKAKNDVSEAVAILTAQYSSPMDSEIEHDATLQENNKQHQLGVISTESSDQLDFPTTCLQDLQNRVFVQDWSIPYKEDESLARCMQAVIKLVTEGVADTDEGCQLFVNHVMPECFRKLCASFPVSWWAQDVQEGVKSMTLIFIDVCAVFLKTGNPPNSIFDVLSTILDPDCEFHVRNRCARWEEPTEVTETNLAEFGWLQELIERMFSRGVLEMMIKYFLQENTTGPTMAAVLLPLSKPAQLYKTQPIKSLLEPCAAKTLKFVNGLTDDDFKTKSVSYVIELVNALRQLCAFLWPDQLQSSTDISMQVTYRLLKSSHFTARTCGFKEIIRLIEESASTKPSRVGIGRDYLISWFAEHSVLLLVLENNIEQSHCNDKLNAVVEFVASTLTEKDLERIWAMQDRPNCTATANVHECVAAAACHFSEPLVRRLLELVKKSWSFHCSEEPKKRLMSFLGKLGRDLLSEGLRIQGSLLVLELIWDLLETPNMSRHLVEHSFEQLLMILAAFSTTHKNRVKRKFAEACVSNIKSGRLMLSSLRFLKWILCGTSAKHNAPSSKQDKTFLDEFKASVKLVFLATKSLSECHEKSVNLFTTYWKSDRNSMYSAQHSPPAPLKIPKDSVALEASMCLDNLYTHREYMSEHLEFLEFALNQCNEYLSYQEAVQIWKTLSNENPNSCSLDQEMCFDFFVRCMADLDEDTRLLLFEQKLLKLNPSSVGHRAFLCFKAFFEAVNRDAKNLRKTGRDQYIIDKPILIGADYLWQLLLVNSSDEIAEFSIDFLLDIFYRQLSPALRKDPVKLHTQFAQQCYNRLQEVAAGSNDLRLLNAISGVTAGNVGKQQHQTTITGIGLGNKAFLTRASSRDHYRVATNNKAELKIHSKRNDGSGSSYVASFTQSICRILHLVERYISSIELPHCSIGRVRAPHGVSCFGYPLNIRCSKDGCGAFVTLRCHSNATVGATRKKVYQLFSSVSPALTGCSNSGGNSSSVLPGTGAANHVVVVGGGTAVAASLSNVSSATATVPGAGGPCGVASVGAQALGNCNGGANTSHFYVNDELLLTAADDGRRLCEIPQLVDTDDCFLRIRTQQLQPQQQSAVLSSGVASTSGASCVMGGAAVAGGVTGVNGGVESPVVVGPAGRDKDSVSNTAIVVAGGPGSTTTSSPPTLGYSSHLKPSAAFSPSNYSEQEKQLPSVVIANNVAVFNMLYELVAAVDGPEIVLQVQTLLDLMPSDPQVIATLDSIRNNGSRRYDSLSTPSVSTHVVSAVSIQRRLAFDPSDPVTASSSAPKSLFAQRASSVTHRQNHGLSYRKDVLQTLFSAKCQPFKLLYNLQVLSAKLMPVNQDNFSQSFCEAFVQAGGFNMILAVLQQSQPSVELTDYSIQRGIYFSALQILRFLSCGKSSLDPAIPSPTPANPWSCVGAKSGGISGFSNCSNVNGPAPNFPPDININTNGIQSTSSNVEDGLPACTLFSSPKVKWSPGVHAVAGTPTANSTLKRNAVEFMLPPSAGGTNSNVRTGLTPRKVNLKLLIVQMSVDELHALLDAIIRVCWASAVSDLAAMKNKLPNVQPALSSSSTSTVGGTSGSKNNFISEAVRRQMLLNAAAIAHRASPSHIGAAAALYDNSTSRSGSGSGSSNAVGGMEGESPCFSSSKPSFDGSVAVSTTVGSCTSINNATGTQCISVRQFAQQRRLDSLLAIEALEFLVECLEQRRAHGIAFFKSLPCIEAFIIDLLVNATSTSVRVTAAHGFYYLSRLQSQYHHFGQCEHQHRNHHRSRLSSSHALCSDSAVVSKPSRFIKNTSEQENANTIECEGRCFFLRILLLNSRLPFWVSSSRARGPTRQVLAQCFQYFDLICRLLCDPKATHPPCGVDTATMLTEEINWLQAFTTTQGLEETDGKLMAGHFNVIRALLLCHQDKKSKLDQNLVEHLLQHYLFPASALIDKKNLEKLPFDTFLPKCTTNESRCAAYEILVELSRGCLSNMATITDWLVTRHHRLNSELAREFEYEPLIRGRATSGLVGLKNAGATCYMNAVLQQIFMQPQLKDAVLGVECIKGGTETLLYQLQNVFAHLTESQLEYYVPEQFWHVFRFWGSPINVREQHDAFEFFTHLLDQVDEYLEKKLGSEPIFKPFYEGVFSDQKICHGCPHRYERDESFMALNLPVKSQSLVESLEQFVKGELLSGDNAYFCERCGQKRDAVKRLCIKRLPPVLAIQLKRFGFDFEANCAVKFDYYFKFPLTLDMTPYTAEYLTKKNLCSNSTVGENLKSESQQSCVSKAACSYDAAHECYQLSGVVVHSGQANTGHYYSFIKDRRDKRASGSWFKFNDTTVERFDMNDSTIEVECFGGNYKAKVSDTSSLYPEDRVRHWNAYMLFYERTTCFVQAPTSSGGLANRFDISSVGVLGSRGRFSLGAAEKLMPSVGISKEPPTAAPRGVSCLASTFTGDSLSQLTSLVGHGERRGGLFPSHVPPQIQQQVHEENLDFMHNKEIYNDAYFRFVLRLSSVNVESLTPADKDFGSLAMESIKLAIHFLLNTYFKYKHRDSAMMEEWICLIDKLIVHSASAASWLIRFFGQQGSSFIKLYLLDCPIRNIRSFFGQIIHKCLQAASESQELDGLLEKLLQFLDSNEVVENCRQSNEYFAVLSVFAQSGPGACGRLYRLHAYRRLILFLLGERACDFENNDAVARRWSQSQTGEVIHAYRILSYLLQNVNLCSLYSEKPSAEYVSPSAVADPVPIEDSDELLKISLTSSGRFRLIRELVRACADTSLAHARCISAALAQLSFCNRSLSRIIIRETLLLFATVPSNELRNLSQLLMKLLQVHDGFRTERVELIINGTTIGCSTSSFDVSKSPLSPSSVTTSMVTERDRDQRPLKDQESSTHAARHSTDKQRVLKGNCVPATKDYTDQKHAENDSVFPNGILAIVAASQENDSRRAYQGIKFLVTLATKTDAAKEHLLRSVQSWQWAVEWLQAQMEGLVVSTNGGSLDGAFSSCLMPPNSGGSSGAQNSIFTADSWAANDDSPSGGAAASVCRGSGSSSGGNEGRTGPLATFVEMVSNEDSSAKTFQRTASAQDTLAEATALLSELSSPETTEVAMETDSSVAELIS